MTLKKDKSTEANRQFWEYVRKTAEEARMGDWQKGAVSRGHTLQPATSLGSSQHGPGITTPPASS